jgi:hypothetical protein
MPPMSHRRSAPVAGASAPRGEAMPSPSETCPLCSYPVLTGAYNMSSHGEMAHLKCPPAPASGNRWPEGVRQLVCLNCSRIFPSDSKMQRLCRACR